MCAGSLLLRNYKSLRKGSPHWYFFIYISRIGCSYTYTFPVNATFKKVNNHTITGIAHSTCSNTFPVRALSYTTIYYGCTCSAPHTVFFDTTSTHRTSYATCSHCTTFMVGDLFHCLRVTVSFRKGIILHGVYYLYPLEKRKAQLCYEISFSV